MKKMQINNRLYSVVDMTEYTDHQDLYNSKTTAIQIGDIVLPIRKPNIDSDPGIYYRQGAKFCEVVKPEPSKMAEYSADKIIDYSNPKSIGEILAKNTLIRNIQNDIMATKDNVFCLPISSEDTPEMKALKTAINAKQVDKKVYEERFDQFQNDMRLLKGNSITLAKMIGICTGFDIACTITLSDKEGAPNPMGTAISIDLTEGRPTKNEPT